MIGENTVEFNDNQMCKAMEKYLKDYEMKNTNFTVTEVTKEKNSFVIKMKETKKHPEVFRESE